MEPVEAGALWHGGKENRSMSRVRDAVFGAVQGVVVSLVLGFVSWICYAIVGIGSYGGVLALRGTDWSVILMGFLVVLSWLWWYPLFAAVLGAIVGGRRARPA
jgi:sterol desaturase/sphingolipid hydroxylase (fatty acid hydroxylase superfamily)